jgi:hypothetical protein
MTMPPALSARLLPKFASAAGLLGALLRGGISAKPSALFRNGTKGA